MSQLNPFAPSVGTAPPCQACGGPCANVSGVCFACTVQRGRAAHGAGVGVGLSPLYTPPEPEPDSVWFGRYAKAQAENNGLRGRLDVAERRAAVLEDRLNELERRMNDESRR